MTNIQLFSKLQVALAHIASFWDAMGQKDFVEAVKEMDEAHAELYQLKDCVLKRVLEDGIITPSPSKVYYEIHQITRAGFADQTEWVWSSESNMWFMLKNASGYVPWRESSESAAYFMFGVLSERYKMNNGFTVRIEE